MRGWDSDYRRMLELLICFEHYIPYEGPGLAHSWIAGQAPSGEAAVGVNVKHLDPEM